MKILPVVLLVTAAGLATWIAFRAPVQDYVPLSLEVAPESAGYPEHIEGEVPAGYEVRAFAVAGPCCKGCCGKLYSALVQVPGVKDAAVSFDEDHTLAYAVVPTGTQPDACVAALTFDKYSAVPTQ